MRSSPNRLCQAMPPYIGASHLKKTIEEANPATRQTMKLRDFADDGNDEQDTRGHRLALLVEDCSAWAETYALREVWVRLVL